VEIRSSAMLRILALEPEDKAIGGYLETDTHYQEFSLGPTGEPDILAQYAKSNYMDLEHFIGIMGKFDPHTPFLIKPVEVDELKYEDLLELYRYFYERETL
jgi:hypothetical protein